MGVAVAVEAFFQVVDIGIVEDLEWQSKFESWSSAGTDGDLARCEACECGLTKAMDNCF